MTTRVEHPFPGVEIIYRDKSSARLVAGRTYMLDGEPHECVSVEESRATLRPVKAREETFLDPKTDTYRTIHARPKVVVGSNALLREVAS